MVMEDLVPFLDDFECAVASDVQDDKCLNAKEIKFKANDIFEGDTIFIHEWDYSQRVKTKKLTLCMSIIIFWKSVALMKKDWLTWS